MASSRKKKSHLVPLAQALEGVIERGRTFKDLDLLRVWDFWTQAVGEEVARHAQPAAFRGGRLLVYVDSTVWAQELQFFKDEIIGRLNAKLGQSAVSEMRFQVGRVDAGAARDDHGGPAG